jgi:hypothetical protein
LPAIGWMKVYDFCQSKKEALSIVARNALGNRCSEGETDSHQSVIAHHCAKR